MKISQILAEASANVIKLEHNQFKAMDRYMNVQLEVTVETNGEKHISQILELLKKGQFSYKKNLLEL